MPTRAAELPLADALGRTGPRADISFAGKRFRDVPVVWQDWTLWQHAAIEQRYGSVARFQRLWLGLPDDAEDDPLQQAQQLAERARRINEGREDEDPVRSKPAQTPLMALGCADGLQMTDQAFYAYVLLGPWEAIEADDGSLSYVLSEEDRLRGPDAWSITQDWVMAHATPGELQSLLVQIIRVQIEATAAELQQEAGDGDHPLADEG